MRFSLFLTTRSTAPSEDRAVMDALVEHVDRGASLGFDAVFQPDHHFTGYAPQASDPFVFAAYLAARHPELWYGFSVQTVPLHHPVRFAERLALLDQLTDGKLLVGVGSGTTPEESIGFGVNFQDTSRLSQENLEIVGRLFAKKPEDEPVQFSNSHYSGAVVSRISPAPYGNRTPTMMPVAARPSSTERAARLGQPAFILNFLPPQQMTPENPFEVFAESYQRYRTALEAQGHPQAVVDHALDWTTHSYQYVHLAETDEQAEAELDVLLGQYQRTVEREFVANKKAEAISGVDLREPTDGTTPEWKRVWCLHGSPETVTAKLKEYADLGVGNLLGGFMGGPLTPERRRATDQSMRLFAERVMPNFRNSK
ncbi:LLM class flavin-dependent oxidoreductase [Kineococcus aurantiacus]|uniref:Alkanesulfonate monooxygenase SsuD/methylene tetrahydromethanopterin reductase-like flavin-dependent oxidoreductase (Luciferase family) n=1 Tax=Kineococcus aurantiacus TaxID=37633 RepID=A0A7Y9AUB4_9ACTN|nr:LLM class flavin-dependent oxidoreductase [Kineococcus aurantiacus]NYD21919.1 alkanesulfonate monooxygenase SsuD/methylene tetrahydromethanopterin reductase-like flavin-dependent oxidoreductase (luciferase family) [Kineococcus aurantiacus]